MPSFDHTLRSQWPLGRIVEVYSDNDEIVLSMKVNTPSSEFIRP